MLNELYRLNPFFEDPRRTYSAREIAKMTNSNHITVAKNLKKLDFIERSKNGPYSGFRAKIIPSFSKLRYLYNLEKLWDSGLIEELINFYDEPSLVLFGSFATASNTPESDIDIAIVSSHKDYLDVSKYERKLNHKVQIFNYTKRDLLKLKETHPELLNSICNGIILNGELEVFI